MKENPNTLITLALLAGGQIVYWTAVLVVTFIRSRKGRGQ